MIFDIGCNCRLSLKKWGQLVKVANLPYPFLCDQLQNMYMGSYRYVAFSAIECGRTRLKCSIFPGLLHFKE